MRSFPRLSVMTLSSAFFLTTAPVWPGPVYENSSGGSFTFYGQFSPAYADFDDGSDSKGEGADNAKSNSRVGFTLAQPFGDYELGFKFETALGLRQTSSISQLYTPDGLHWDRQRLRHVDFSLKTPGYGTFYLGQGSMASDGIGDRSQSPTTVVNDVSIGDTAGVPAGEVRWAVHPARLSVLIDAHHMQAQRPKTVDVFPGDGFEVERGARPQL